MQIREVTQSPVVPDYSTNAATLVDANKSNRKDFEVCLGTFNQETNADQSRFWCFAVFRLAGMYGVL